MEESADALEAGEDAVAAWRAQRRWVKEHRTKERAAGGPLREG